ncbi:Protein mlc [Baekduia alba]|uniref:ROK family transcriptional regulator n=1 Tax=Baekduia alba TaxID=2997333 RepID=UPI00234057A3|nr:ROK family transcriptional regulator [Baekduia alba]WCB96266.1 Protein mlc [Baekduia alba]
MKDSPGSLGSLRQRNRLRIIDVLRQAGSASRVDLVRDTGLSRTTVSKLVAELQAEGLVVERGNGDGHAEDDATTANAVGRPPVALTLNPAAGAAVGIDFGHDLVRVAVADLSGTVIAEARDDIDVDSRAAQAIDLAATMVDDQLKRLSMDLGRTVGVGVAVSAPILRELGDPGATSILPGWGPFAPGGELERRLGRPVLMGNDANLGALAEVRHGAGRGARNVVYVMLSGGIGAGLILDGALFLGHSGLTGELGHVATDPDGRICRCGNRGCLETVASAAALLEALRPLHGPDVTLDDAIAMARAGDPGCRRLFADAGRTVGRAVGAICNLVNPELVIVGGEMSVVGDVLVDAVGEGIALATIPAIARDAEVVPGSLGERAEVLGAIGLVLAETGADAIAAMGPGSA